MDDLCFNPKSTADQLLDFITDYQNKYKHWPSYVKVSKEVMRELKGLCYERQVLFPGPLGCCPTILYYAGVPIFTEEELKFKEKQDEAV